MSAPSWPAQPLVSIVVDNYNYARFLPVSVDSALAQTWPRVEVIVVDDGSTDGSRDVVASYGTRVKPVLKANGGQGSSYNAGWQAARGDIIVFLDADDALMPETAAKVARAFLEHPDAAKVQWRMAWIDGAGAAMGQTWPPRGERMPNGLLPVEARRFCCYTWPPSSGNAYPRWVLDRILPMPETACYRLYADMFPAHLSVSLGPVVSLEDEAGYYRFHGRNPMAATVAGAPALAPLRELFERFEAICCSRVRLDPDLAGLATVDLWPLSLLAWRALSAKMDPSRHPFAERTCGVCRRGLKNALTYPDTSLLRRLRFAVWFALLPVVPRRVAWWLANRRRPPFFGNLPAPEATA